MNMIAFVLFAMMACASAAPRYHHHHRHPPYHYENNNDMNLDNFFDRELFDTRRLWDELRREMMGLDQMLADLCKRFPNNESDLKIEGNEYKIKIRLSGFEENEIAVKAKKGLLIVQAVHKAAGEPERSYLDVRTLPDFVDVNGSWTYENGVLSMVFPLEHKDQEPTEVAVTQVPVTQAPEHSREVMETDPTGSEAQDADVGVDRGDLGQTASKSIFTNEIPHGQSTVEATTYAVDLKDEVELVPLNTNYKQF